MTDEKISQKDIVRIARMCRLQLEDDKSDKLRSDLNDILTYVSRLEQLETTSVTPMSHVQTTTNVLRADAVEPLLSAAEALEQAPETTGTYIKVPLVIEG